jgi:hypothetical protein
MKQHKWHKEIKAWADGAEIESNGGCGWFRDASPDWNDDDYEFRIKPTHKEPQYLYIWFEPNYGTSYITKNKSVDTVPAGYEYIGKIKLEVEDHGD